MPRVPKSLLIPTLSVELGEPMPVKTKQERILGFMNHVEERVMAQLQLDHLKIPAQPIPLLFDPNSIACKLEEEKTRLSNLQAQKEQTLLRLSKIKEEESYYRRRKMQLQRLNNPEHSSAWLQKESPEGSKSRLSRLTSQTSQNHQSHSIIKTSIKEEAERIRKFKRQRKEFEIRLKRKQEQYQEFLKRTKQEEEKLNEQARSQANQQKRQAILARQKQLLQQKEARTKSLERHKAELIALKSKPKLYEILEEQFLTKEQKQYELVEEQLKRRAKSKLTDYEEIKEHERRYEEVIAAHQYQRKSRISSLAINKPTSFYRKSKFFMTLEAEEAARRDKEVEKASERRLLEERRLEFGEKVRQEYAPAIRVNSQQSLENISKPRIELSPEAIKEKGNIYLREALSTLDHSSSKRVEPPPTTPMPKYRDYLKESYATHKKDQKSTAANSEVQSTVNECRSAFSLNVREAERVLQSVSSRKQKLQRIRAIAARLDFPGRNRDIVGQIAAKIQILEKL